MPNAESSDDRQAVRALAGRGSLYTAAVAVQMSASMIAIPIATRLMPPGQYGIVALALIVSLLLGGVAAAGLPVVITRTFFESDGPRQARALFPLVAVAALLLIGLAEAARPLWVGVLGHVSDLMAIHLAVWTILPAGLTAMCESYFRVAERGRAFVALALLAGPGGQFLGVSLVAALPSGGPTEYMIGVAGGWSVAATYGIAVIRPWRDLRRLSQPLVRNSLAIGLPLIPHGIAWTLLALGDRTVIQHVDGSAPVGRYQVAYTVGALGLTLVTAIANAWTPIVFRATDSMRWQVHRETLSAVQTVAASTAAGLALVGPPLLVLATPASYHEQSLKGVVAFVALSTLPWVVYGSGMQVLLWKKRTRSLTWITPLAALVNLALVRLLLGPFGLTGAAAATLVAYGILAAFVWRTSRRLAPVHGFFPATLIPWALSAALITIGAVVPTDGSWLGIRVALTAVALIAALLRVWRMVSAKTFNEPNPIESRPAVVTRGGAA
jgi:O-antigen/teichoic acid export membrane protein